MNAAGGIPRGVWARGAAHAPADLRGSAFGAFNLACGVALLLASALAGGLWDAFGPCTTLVVGTGITVVAWVARGRQRLHALDRPR